MCVPLAHAGALIPTYIAVVLALGFLSQPHCGWGVFSGKDGDGAVAMETRYSLQCPALSPTATFFSLSHPPQQLGEAGRTASSGLLGDRLGNCG